MFDKFIPSVKRNVDLIAQHISGGNLNSLEDDSLVSNEISSNVVESTGRRFIQIGHRTKSLESTTSSDIVNNEDNENKLHSSQQLSNIELNADAATTISSRPLLDAYEKYFPGDNIEACPASITESGNVISVNPSTPHSHLKVQKYKFDAHSLTSTKQEGQFYTFPIPRDQCVYSSDDVGPLLDRYLAFEESVKKSGTISVSKEKHWRTFRNEKDKFTSSIETDVTKSPVEVWFHSRDMREAIEIWIKNAPRISDGGADGAGVYLAAAGSGLQPHRFVKLCFRGHDGAIAGSPRKSKFHKLLSAREYKTKGYTDHDEFWDISTITWLLSNNDNAASDTIPDKLVDVMEGEIYDGSFGKYSVAGNIVFPVFTRLLKDNENNTKWKVIERRYKREYDSIKHLVVSDISQIMAYGEPFVEFVFDRKWIDSEPDWNNPETVPGSVLIPIPMEKIVDAFQLEFPEEYRKLVGDEVDE